MRIHIVWKEWSGKESEIESWISWTDLNYYYLNLEKNNNHKTFISFTLFIKIYNETWNENFSLQFYIFRFFLIFLFSFVFSRFVSLIFLFNIVTRVSMMTVMVDGSWNKIRTLYVSSFVKLAKKKNLSNSQIKISNEKSSANNSIFQF